MLKLSYPNPNNVPKAVKNVALKYAFTYAVQEALRLRHNDEGAKFRNGEITEVEWKAFLNGWYEPRSRTVTTDLLELRQVCKDYSVQFADAIDLEGIPIGS